MFLRKKSYDVIIVGGGHAGTEASLAAARMGASTLLLTHNIETLGKMSCNPAIGGIGKGHLVKEIDALGGLMAKAADQAGIHFRILNSKKGPAVRATRVQTDRLLYESAVRCALEKQPCLTIFQQSVNDLIIKQDQVMGVVTQMGYKIFGQTVILTVGTFLGGRIYIGTKNYEGGRMGDLSSNILSQRLRELPIRVNRLKTGTPPRIDARSINFSLLKEQPGDNPIPTFSFTRSGQNHPRQVNCYIARTNEETHDIVRENLDCSPIYSGIIDSLGPRYCPSIEDKVVRFSEKKSHQIFVEPEGLNVNEVYPNGISTSLPFDIQLKFVQSIRGFEEAHITRPGYAIEYDFFDLRDLKSTLETRCIKGLFFAGQINGTTGYEEAAAQGLLAAVNAVCKVFKKDSWVPNRNEAYLGVMVDDLVTRGTTEPYRMFTSRAEYRLLLREDNADLRLTEIGRKLGLIDEPQWYIFNKKREAIKCEEERLSKYFINPDETISSYIKESFNNNRKLKQKVSALELLSRPDFNYHQLMKIKNLSPGVKDLKVVEQIEIRARYSGYINRQIAEINRARKSDLIKLPKNLDYNNISGLSSELKEKFNSICPETIGQASRIPGVTPVAISLIIVYLKKTSNLKEY